MNKKVDIFIKSYSKDFWMLQIALKTITRNVIGYNNIILIIPEHEMELFDTRGMPERTLIHYVKEEGPGWLFQQWCKINAARYSDADYILFGDSDCFFDHKIDLQEFVADDKPEILYTDWQKVGDAIVWKKPTEDLMGEVVDWEYMRRNCCIYHRETLININKWNPNLKHIILNSEKFSEFNLMGAYAFKFEREKYNFVNTDNWTYVEPKAIQVWSHGRKDTDSVLHLTEYIRTLEAIMKCFDVPVPNQ